MYRTNFFIYRVTIIFMNSNITQFELDVFVHKQNKFIYNNIYDYRILEQIAVIILIFSNIHRYNITGNINNSYNRKQLLYFSFIIKHLIDCSSTCKQITRYIYKYRKMYLVLTFLVVKLANFISKHIIKQCPDVV